MNKDEQHEVMDIVNEQDEVVGQAAMKEIYAQRLLHRIVHVIVQDEKGRFGVQKRSATKVYKPLHWTTAVGGHPNAGETYKQAAIREGLEELGLLLQVNKFRKILFEDPERPGLKKFLGVFEAVNAGPFEINSDEAEDFRFFERQEFQQMLLGEQLFHPELKFILKELYYFRTEKEVTK